MPHAAPTDHLESDRASSSTTAAAVETTVGRARHDRAPPDRSPTSRRGSDAVPADRCEANKAAGTITFLTGFDFAAAASIIDVFVATQRATSTHCASTSTIKPSFSTDNYPLIAADKAQFASGGSFGELVDYAGRNDAGFMALAVDGRTGIDALIVKHGQMHRARRPARARRSA